MIGTGGRFWLLAAVAFAAVARCGWANAAAPLVLEAKIPLGEVRGRIDHLAFDPERNRLIVAELGNGSVAVVDVVARRVVHRIRDLAEPQGVAYVASTDTIYVANAGDGSVRLFRATDFAELGRIALSDGADNVRVDAAAGQVYVGYGSGGLAVIDPQGAKKIAAIALKAHPESFRLDPASPRIFVNVPDAGAIAVVDRRTGRQTATWDTGAARGNFPMALDGARMLVAFRQPPRLIAFDKRSGAKVADLELCGDADDVFVDAKRRRVYVSCGAGFLDVFETGGEGSYRRTAEMRTAAGARTSLFVPKLDRLFLAVRASGQEPAAIWVLRPSP